MEGAVDIFLLASFFRTASLVLWSAVDETVPVLFGDEVGRFEMLQGNVEEAIKGGGEEGQFLLEGVFVSSCRWSLDEGFVGLMEGSDLSQDLRDVLQDVSVGTGCLCRDKGHLWELETMFKHRNP